MDPYLIIPAQGDRPVALTHKQHWTIGRSRSSDVAIDDQWISRSHAMLQRMDGGEIYLIDFGSRNGSFVNGRRVSTPVRLADGDRLKAGQAELEFHFPGTQIGAGGARHPAGADGTLARTAAMTLPMRERRMISVMVVDIRDFTGLTRRLGEDLLSQVVGSFFRRTGAVIREHGSWVDKYIGDALMAVWFHDDADVDNSADGESDRGSAARAPAEIGWALQALCGIHRVTASLSAEFALPEPLRIGAGVNTGYAMVGDTGSRDRADYTALGDTVNAAFRLESATKDLGRDVVIGQTTYAHLRRPPAAAAAPFVPHTVLLKGYESETTAYACSFPELEAWVPRWSTARPVRPGGERPGAG